MGQSIGMENDALCQTLPAEKWGRPVIGPRSCVPSSLSLTGGDEQPASHPELQSVSQPTG